MRARNGDATYLIHILHHAFNTLTDFVSLPFLCPAKHEIYSDDVQRIELCSRHEREKPGMVELQAKARYTRKQRSLAFFGRLDTHIGSSSRSERHRILL